MPVWLVHFALWALLIAFGAAGLALAEEWWFERQDRRTEDRATSTSYGIIPRKR